MFVGAGAVFVGEGRLSADWRFGRTGWFITGGCGVLPAPGRGSVAFDRDTYKQRNTVERCINRLRQWRGIATRYEKTATLYLAGLHIAGIFLWSAR